MNDSKILSSDSILIETKLTAYFQMLNELNKFRRLYVYRKIHYPTIEWINAIMTFYDVMYMEANEPENKEKYKKTFEVLSVLDHGTNIEYETLLSITRDLMKFASDEGLTKIQKIQTPENPEGAEYE